MTGCHQMKRSRNVLNGKSTITAMSMNASLKMRAGMSLSIILHAA
jgi:hypothetical protein